MKRHGTNQIKFLASLVCRGMITMLDIVIYNSPLSKQNQQRNLIFLSLLSQFFPLYFSIFSSYKINIHFSKWDGCSTPSSFRGKSCGCACTQLGGKVIFSLNLCIMDLSFICHVTSNFIFIFWFFLFILLPKHHINYMHCNIMKSFFSLMLLVMISELSFELLSLLVNG